MGVGDDLPALCKKCAVEGSPPVGTQRAKDGPGMGVKQGASEGL